MASTDAVVSLTVGTGGVRADEHGVPIHGVLAAYPGWLVTASIGQRADSRPGLRRQAAPAGVLSVPARADPGDHAGRPDPHHRDDGHADNGGVGAAVLRLPPVFPDSGRAARGVDAHHAQHATPARRQRGPARPASPRTGPAATEPLKNVTYDDGFDNVPDGAVFALAGGDRRIEVKFEKGYPAAQLFAPRKRRPRRHRADGGADRRAATRKLPLRRLQASPRRRASRSR